MFSESSSASTNTFLNRVSLERRVLKTLRRIGNAAPDGMSLAALSNWSAKQQPSSQISEAFKIASQLSVASGMWADQSLQVFRDSKEGSEQDIWSLLLRLESMAAAS